MRQTMGNPTQDIPSAPSLDIRSTESLTPWEVDDLMLGSDIIFFLEEEYVTYCHTYLMPPLTGVRTPTRRVADMPSSSRARAADVPSTSRAGTSRGGARGIPPTCHYAGWPDLSTKLTGWQYGTSYSIPLEPLMPDHRYINDPDSPPPPREYTEGLLRVVASLESMVLPRETLLYASGVRVPLLQTGPFRPSRAARRGVSTRSRGGRRAPARQDDESSEEEESEIEIS
ncbi:uncharacterized protein LOC114314425 isoform X2 [Camellia sinensis]|uniref:uncharacterized protein LOC114314425 isoform X2 n=1 Tax=Camellia sinensis TaxID=4442 RepID=UPI0010367F1E|nr:uncharacterized protein LOC114314425 isoform X2 [Camellia sinensis]